MIKEIKTIQIGDCVIGYEQPTYIIAEIGLNHNGDVDIAKRLIDTASDAKVNAVKFQRRHLPSLYSKDMLDNTMKYEQHFQYAIPIYKKTALSDDEFVLLRNYSIEKGLEFLCTPFDIKSADFLDGLGVNAFKISSADLTNLELLEHVALKGKPMLVSTGMSYWDEIEKAVNLLREKEALFALLHCRSVYPVWPREVNLKMINKLSHFSCPVGYSGHDIGITIPLVAASMGACIIEKHITLDEKMSGPDHKISLEPFALKRLVRDIRVADLAMGKSKRFLLRGEIMNRELLGKSLKARVSIKRGVQITKDMINVQGPGKGLPPNRIDELIGKALNRDLKEDDFFIEEDLGSNGKINFTNSFRTRWGLISRFCDFNEMLAFKPKVIEFHLAEKDFEIGFNLDNDYSQELVVHGPEYMGDQIYDLCSMNNELRLKSVDMVQKVINFTKSIAPHFQGKPKIVIHSGAQSLNTKRDKSPLIEALCSSFKEINRSGVELLLENLPPYPWHFGGQWKGNYFMDANDIRSFCEEIGINICFDLSHAALYCNAKEKSLVDFIKTVMPFIAHIHFADAYGLDGEGVQIGEGDIDFNSIMSLFSDYKGTWIPEIWRGHLNNGKAFIKALIKLKAFNL